MEMHWTLETRSLGPIVAAWDILLDTEQAIYPVPLQAKGQTESFLFKTINWYLFESLFIRSKQHFVLSIAATFFKRETHLLMWKWILTPLDLKEFFLVPKGVTNPRWFTRKLETVLSDVIYSKS